MYVHYKTALRESVGVGSGDWDIARVLHITRKFMLLQCSNENQFHIVQPVELRRFFISLRASAQPFVYRQDYQLQVHTASYDWADASYQL